MTAGYLLLVGTGLAAGGVGALFGIGGGIVLVPALTLVAGLPLASAVAVSLVAVVAMSLSASAVHLRAARVDLASGQLLQFFSVAGAVAAALVAGVVPDDILYIGFALLLVGMAVRMAWKGATRGPLPTRRTPAAWGACFGSGVIAGLLGVGGGVINTPVLHLLLGRSMAVAVATSSYMIGATGSAAALVYLARGNLDPAAAAPVVLGVLGGAAGVAAVGHRIDHRVLRVLFSLLLLFVAFQMFRRGLVA